MLKIIDITKEYVLGKKEEPVVALKGVSIEFRRNEFVSILGPSGCGKTTLLNIIGGLDRYTSGDIQIDNISTKEYDDVDWDTYRNRRIGFVFQSYNLIPHMNILRNVALSLTLAGVSKEERYRRAQEALEKVGLGDQVKKKPMQLSGGQMQRVAIARALVNNPEIILADEPTGALDSESGLQVMDLLKEVAKDRLVIMVTHNPSLAEEYSTRIVYLKDGAVEGDTMPYNSQEEPEGELFAGQAVEKQDEANGENLVQDEVPVQNEAAESSNVESDEAVEGDNAGTPKKKFKFAQLFHKRREQGKSAMKLRTAIMLSWNNLLSKKGRTITTSVAGSIGIIGIILVLSLSTGAKAYISSLEENALSSYPLTVSSSNVQVSEMLSTLMSAGQSDLPKNPDSTTIHTQEILSKLVEKMLSGEVSQTNDLKSFRNYIEENFDKSIANVIYNYGITFNAYIKDPGNENRYMKPHPYAEVMDSVLNSDIIKTLFKNIPNLSSMINMATTMMPDMVNAWSEMPSNQKLLESQYELVGSESRWPTRADEVVVVVDNKNQLIDYQLFMLGLKTQDDVEATLAGKSFAGEDAEFDVSRLLQLRYKLIVETDYLEEDFDEDGNSLGTWHQHYHGEQDAEYIDALEQKIIASGREIVELKVVGVIRPKPGLESGCIPGVLGYTEALNNAIVEIATQHPAIQKLLSLIEESRAERTANTKKQEIVCPIYGDYKINNYLDSSNRLVWYDKKANAQSVLGEEDNYSSDLIEFLRALGIVNFDEPSTISFYCSTFDAKDKVVDFIEGYNASVDKSKNIRYTDTLATMMGFVNTMATTITGVLVAFAAISLVVSTIMIAIIIYTSVLERRKEIGVLRSIGARKKDISRVFLAESAILGGYSGIIGILVSYCISLLGTFVLKLVFGIGGLMSVTWWHCIMMLGISILLSMLAGFIPSRIAAKKDPAIALRSE